MSFRERAYSSALGAALIVLCGAVNAADPVCYADSENKTTCIVESTVKGKEFLRVYTETNDIFVPRKSALGATLAANASKIRAIDKKIQALDAGLATLIEEAKASDPEFNELSLEPLPPEPTLPLPPRVTGVRCTKGNTACTPIYAHRSAPKKRIGPGGMRLTDRQCYGEGAYRVCSETYQDGKGNIQVRSSDSMGNSYSVGSEIETRADGSTRVRSSDTQGNSYEIRSWSDRHGVHTVDTEGNRCTITPSGQMIGC